MKLAVLNPGGNDAEQAFPDGAGAPASLSHPPVNYHAFAACTGGTFYRDVAAIPKENRHVIVLLRRDLKVSLRAVKTLKGAGKIVAISLKESGAFQAAELLSKPKHWTLFGEVCRAAHGVLSSTEDLLPLYLGAGAVACEYIPTPYPVEDPRWDFGWKVGWSERRGIFIGTREFEVPSRNHLAAVAALRPHAILTGQPVTVVNTEGRYGRHLLAALDYPKDLLRVEEGRRPYPDYLRLVASHRVVFQLDASSVPGQVAGDALLCGVPCVGGNGAVERLAFSDLCGHGRSQPEVVRLCAEAAGNEAAWNSYRELAKKRAHETLSFSVVAAQLTRFFHRLEVATD